MDLRFKVTAREIFVFSVNNYYRSIAGIISIVCTLVSLALITVNRERIGVQMADVLFLVVVVVALGQVFLMRQKASKQAEDPVSSQEMIFKLDQEGIRVRQGNQKGHVSWDHVLRVKKISGIYILYLSRNQAYLFPERVFRGAGKQQFLRLIGQHIPAEKRKGIRL